MKKFTAFIIAAVLAFVCCSCVFPAKPTEKADGDSVKTTEKISQSSAESTQVVTETTSETTTEVTSAATTEVISTLSAVTAAQPQRTSRDIEQFRGKKLLAITFDDGPYTPVTMSLLNRLDKYNARVTFFVLGSRLDENRSYRETMKRAYDMGNQIASHTYSHSTLTKLTPAQLRTEIDKANASVKNVIGVEPDAIRPPYGATNSTVEEAMKKHIIMWSIDTLDWKSRNAESVCNNMVNSAFDGGIVLLHDLYQTSVDGAVKAMEILQKQGYAFVTVDELAQLRGVQMDTSTKYFQFKPVAQ